jgi:photosystem II stability/assembly factor-like uncharacterized protein
MSCLINNINNISIINKCEFVLGGINQLWVANYDESVYKSLSINNLGIVTSINSGIKFNEVLFNKGATRFNESYNYNDKKYEQTLDLELPRYDYDKRDVIDSLIKAKLMFIFKDNHGKYFLMGEKSGIYSNSYSATTDAYTGKSAYIFKFNTKSDYGLLGLDESVVLGQTQEDCSILNTQMALSSSLFINQYGNCIVGDLNNFVDPNTIVVISPTGGTGATGSTYSINPSELDNFIDLGLTFSSQDASILYDIFIKTGNTTIYTGGIKIGSSISDIKGSCFKSDDGGNNWYSYSNVSFSATDFGAGTTIIAQKEFRSFAIASNNISIYSVGTIHLNSTLHGNYIRPFIGQDNGTNWTARKIIGFESNTGSLFDICSDSLRFFAVGSNIDSGKGLIVRGLTAGNEWYKYSESWTPSDVVEFYGVDCIGSNNAVAVGYDSTNTGVIFKTSDGGLNWSKYSSGWTSTNVQVFKKVKMLDLNTYYAVGYASGGFGVIFRTTNGGTTWSLFKNFTTSQIVSINDIMVISSTNIKVYGYDNQNTGSIIETFDGGVTWIKYPDSWTSNSLWRIHAADIGTNGVEFICGDKLPSPTKGVIFRNIPS